MPEDVPILSNEADRKKLMSMVGEMTKCMSRIDTERESISETAEAAEKQFGIKKKLIRKIATTMYKHKYADVKEENDHFEYLYEALAEGKKV